MAIHPAAWLCPKFLMYRSDRGLQCPGRGSHVKAYWFYQKSFGPRHPWVPFQFKKKKKESFLDGHNSQKLGKLVKSQGWGTQTIFWRSVRPEVWNPYPIKDFSHSKNGWLDSFLEIFANWDHFLRVFLPQKWLILILFANFVKWDHPLRIVLTKMRPMSKDFWWKSNPFGRHIPRTP